MDSKPQRRRRKADKKGRVIAVTGVHGALAQRLVSRLDEDNRVARLVLIDRTPAMAPLLKAASYRVDLTEANADGHIAEILRREGVTTLVHLAFHARPRADVRSAYALEAVGTMHVISAAAQAAGAGRPLRHLLAVTTGLVYGARRAGPSVLGEAEPLHGAPGYGFIEGKVEADRLLMAARRRLAIPMTVLRPSVMLGPGDDGVMADYLGASVVPTIWGYDPVVQLIHPEDVVEACRTSIDRQPDGVYNLAGTGALPLGTVVRLAGKLDVPFLACAAPMALEVLWHLGASPIPGGHAPYLQYPVVLDGTLAGRDLAFRARRGTLETLEHYLGRRFSVAA